MEQALPLQVGRFLVEVEHTVVAAFQDCSGLAVEVEVQEVIEGGENGFVRKLPGRMKYPNIVLKRGVTTDAAFATWRPRMEGGKLTVTRKSLAIILFGHDGVTVKTWEVTGAYPVKWTGPELKAASMEAAIETLELAHEGWREV